MWTRWLLVIGLLTCGAYARAGDATSSIKVLYAGNPGSDRENDFVAFLERHFNKVGKTSYEKFNASQAKGYDVVIFDWTSIYPRDKDGKIKKPFNGLHSPTPPELSEQYDRPSILIGAAGGFLGTALKLKIDWR